MNFRDKIKSIDPKTKEIKAFGSTIMITEMSGKDLVNYIGAETPFDRLWLLFNSCVEQDDDKRLTIKMFDKVLKDNLEEIDKIVEEIIILSGVLAPEDDEIIADKKK